MVLFIVGNSVYGVIVIDLVFLFRLLLAFFAYFVIGSYYNYSTYGATGLDMIPYVLSVFCISIPGSFDAVNLLDIVTSGGTCHIFFVTSFLICALRYDRQEVVTLLSNFLYVDPLCIFRFVYYCMSSGAYNHLLFMR